MIYEIAEVAELADAADSKSAVVHPTCGFDSHLRHHRLLFLAVWLSQMPIDVDTATTAIKIISKIYSKVTAYYPFVLYFYVFKHLLKNRKSDAVFSAVFWLF
jgi:hypothetical protein